MRDAVVEESKVVAFETEGLTITVTQRFVADVVATPFGGYLWGSMQPLCVSVETPDQCIVHALRIPNTEAAERAS